PMNFKWMLLPGFLLVLLCLPTLIHGEKQKQSHSFSVVTMVPLLKLEQKLINNLEEYAKAMNQKLQIIRRLLETMRTENEKGQLDAVSYLSNPLNAFSLIRRLHQDWDNWHQYMQQPVGASQMLNFDILARELPVKEDLQDACEGIFRIQRNYDLKIKDIVNGNLQGKQHNASMRFSDIFAMGAYLLETSRPVAAIQWLKEVTFHSQEDLLPMEFSVKVVEWLQLFALALKQNQNYLHALDMLDSCLELRPHDAVLLRQRREVKGLIGKPHNSTPKMTPEMKILKEMATACNVTHKNPTGLYCFYNFSTTPFLRLAPLKVEQVGLHPYLVLYHEVLSPAEITSIINAPQKMKKAETVNRNLTNSQTHYRTAKSYWMPKMMSELGQRINRRIRDMTGLNLEESEAFQIINYGIGGHYGPHYDYFTFSSDHSKRKKKEKILGDRIATVLFYLSDVEQGGATAFTDAGYTVYPRAGTALFWYNLNTDGDIDPLTRHTACTLIAGSKWVMTEWIMERSQIFTKPCLPRKR
ncbi:hypothetical protein KR032_009957, partial [Drosophila birchii]